MGEGFLLVREEADSRLAGFLRTAQEHLAGNGSAHSGLDPVTNNQDNLLQPSPQSILDSSSLEPLLSGDLRLCQIDS